MADQLKGLGAPPEIVAKWAAMEAAAQKPKPFVVWASNWPLFEVFVSAETQWRWSGGMVPEMVGLDYPAVVGLARTIGVPWNRQTLSLVIEMERVALKEFRARAKADADRHKASK